MLRYISSMYICQGYTRSSLRSSKDVNPKLVKND